MAPSLHPDHPPIPQEVIDLVLDEARDDRPTLMTCSLVSSAFILGSRRHLYSTIAFTCGKNADRCEQFHALSVANRDLPTYVRELRIYQLVYGFERPIDRNYDKEDTDASEGIPVPTVLRAILKSLRNLHSLSSNSVQSLKWNMLDAQQQTMFLELIASTPLSTITIKGFVWPLSSFAKCRQLRELTVADPENDCDHRHKADLALRGAQLKKLYLGCDLDVLSASFGVFLPSLQNFTVTCASLSDVAICQDIFGSASDTLETLELSIEATVVPESFQAKLLALRRLSITFSQGTVLQAVQWLLLFMENVSAHLLEDLSLSAPGDHQTFNDPLWSPTRALLTPSPTFPHLRHVTVYRIHN